MMRPDNSERENRQPEYEDPTGSDRHMLITGREANQEKRRQNFDY